ncbi:hypothetical protein DL93DRAFT_2170376 [Clavulina sp. PMI_390]|nr:hypothetical protein DL93DRAFT_2170376 [Clavulina sp. PMI_390]
MTPDPNRDGENAASESLSELRDCASAIPIMALPPELLGEIFLQSIDYGALGEGDHFERMSKLRKTRGSIISVCSRWREVAFSTSAFWSTTSFPLPVKVSYLAGWVPSLSIPPRAYDLFNLEVGSAGSSPISLTTQFTDFGTDYVPYYERLVPELSQAIYPVLPRCKNFVITAPAQVVLGLINSDPARFANLRSLSLDASGGFLGVDSEKINQLGSVDLSQSPLIRDLWIRFSVSPDHPFYMRICLPNANALHRLVLKGPFDVQRMLTNIISASNLRALSWGSPTSAQPHATPYSKVCLPGLCHLQVSGVEPRDILGAIDAPCLHTLTISGEQIPKALKTIKHKFPLLRVLNATSDLIRGTIPPQLVAEICESHSMLEVLIVSADLRGWFVKLSSLRNIRLLGAMGDGPNWGDTEILLKSWAEGAREGELQWRSRRLFSVQGFHELDENSGEEWEGYVERCFAPLGDLSIFVQLGLDRFPYWQYFDQEWHDFFTKVEADPSFVPYDPSY